MKEKTNSLLLVLLFGMMITFGCKKEENAFIVKKIETRYGNQAISIYPHSDDFKSTQLHGEKFLKDKASCTTCHGNDFRGGNANVSCLKCHNYPHEASWAQPKNHGVFFNELSARQDDIKDPTQRNFSECMMCHENKPNPIGTFKERHPKDFVSCASCHADLPHGKKFLPTSSEESSAISHSKYLKKHPESKGSCFSCHLNTDRSAPKPVDSCLNCHEGPPFEEAKEE